MNNNNNNTKTSQNELSNDIQELLDNYIVKKVNSHTSEQIKPIIIQQKEKLIPNIKELSETVEDLNNNAFDISDKITELSKRFEDEIDNVQKDMNELKNINGKAELLIGKNNTIIQTIEETENANQNRHSDLSNQISNSNENLKKELLKKLENAFAQELLQKNKQTETIEETMKEVSLCIGSVQENILLNINKLNDEYTLKLEENRQCAKNFSIQNTRDIKAYINENLVNQEKKIIETTTKIIKKNNLLLRIVLALSSVNVVGIIALLIMKLI